MSEEKTQAEATEAKADTKTEKKAEKKEPPKRNWKDSEYHGRRVYTPKGVCLVKAEDKQAERFLVTDADGKDHDLSMKSVRFKAVDDKYRDHYEVDKNIRTASGAPSISCGDDVAEAMKGLTEPELAALAKENGLDDNWNKWSGLNPGQKRMNIGNMLRNRLKKSQKEGSETPEPTFFGNPANKAAEVRKKQLAEEAKKAEQERAKKEKEKEDKKKEKAKAKKDAEKKAA